MGCTQVTDAALAHLVGTHTLWLNGCMQITDAAMVHLVGVRVLHIAGCPQFTDAALAPLMDRGTTIHRVEMPE